MRTLLATIMSGLEYIYVIITHRGCDPISIFMSLSIDILHLLLS